MTRFVTSVYTGMLREHIDSQLESARQNTEAYLNTLSHLYKDTKDLSHTLSEKLKLGTDTTFLMKLTNINLFKRYLDTYIEYVITYSSLSHVSQLSR